MAENSSAAAGTGKGGGGAWKFAAAAAVGLAVMVVANMTADNALAVFVDGERVGYIEIFAGWNSGDFHEMAVRELRPASGAGVIVDQTVMLGPARAPRAEIVPQDVMLLRLARDHLTHRFQALAVYAWDCETGAYALEALMRSMADVDALREALARRFVNGNTVDFWLEPELLVAPVEFENGEADFLAPEMAFVMLDRRVRAFVLHELRPGDTLTGLADDFRADVAEMLRDNPQIDPLNLTAGETILIPVTMPLISVVTVDEVLEIVTLERGLVELPVSDLPAGRARVRQEGRDGQLLRVTRIYRLNGEIFDELAWDREVLNPPEPRIVEVGR